MKKLYLPLMAYLLVLASPMAQERPLSREEIMSMTIDQLSELPLDQLMAAVETIGVGNVDELFALIMNKSVSSATKEEESTFTSPLSSTVISREEMRTWGVTTIEEALRLVPGMIVAEKTNGVYDVHMRGLSNIPDNNVLLYTENMNILVMVDGRIAHNYSVGTPFFETLPVGIGDVERIEVVRGAASALYGPNAVAGMVNIITEKPDRARDVAQGSLQMGNNTALADFGVRKVVNGSLAVGLTGNFQLRRRPNALIPYIAAQGAYVAIDPSALSPGTTLTAEQVSRAVGAGRLMPIRGVTALEVEQLSNIYGADAAADGSLTFHSVYAVDADIRAQFREPGLARRNAGINAYVSITPADDVRLDISGGYQYALYATTPIGADDEALRYRKSNTAYVNLNAAMGPWRLIANYQGGPQDVATGSPAFNQAKTHALNAQLDYDLRAGRLGIRPGVSWQYVRYDDSKPGYFDYGDGPEERSGYWGYYSRGENSAHLSDLAPSLRLDWRQGGLRLIVAARADKTSIPDKWNHSWQFSASYSIDDDNFVRLGYGRAFRSSSLVNTSSNFSWRRPEGTMPQQISFVGNAESPLMHVDNVDVGYRLKPRGNLLVDAEAYYSRSTDYGALKSWRSNFVLRHSDLLGVVGEVLGGQIAQEGAAAALAGAISSRSYIRYEEMPFVVHQIGLGVNVDWIISPRLIAKLNANIQRTTIDKYYQYSRNGMIARQLQTSGAALQNPQTGVGAIMAELMGDAAAALAGGETVQGFMGGFQGAVAQSVFDTYAAMSADERQTYLADLRGDGNSLLTYYALKYGILYEPTRGEYYLGTTVVEDSPRQNGHRHKATPAVYGMLGLIGKPTERWSIAAFANLIGKREYTTMFGTESVAPRFTVNLKVGWRPVEQAEVFVNAHNLFNNDRREFIYTDKIGGVYTVGVNFGI